MIDGHTLLVPHIGYPTGSFKAPMIYNPWFESRGVNAVVVPLAVTADDFVATMKALSLVRNMRGALITMPHKIAVVDLLAERSKAVAIAGSCNAVLRRDDGSYAGDMFDGTGFTRGLANKGFRVAGSRCLVVGSGGVGSAIAAALAADGATAIAVNDTNPATAEGLGARLRRHYPAIDVSVRSNDPAGFDLVVNATPLGMKPGDPLPFDAGRLSASTFVGEVVMKQEITPLLAAARARGCRIQVGTDMLFEMIPAYLEYFGFGRATADDLRAVAQVSY
ncbi:MAG: shikimate dehydrogenase [Burkholderiales bacterium]|nr:shikimate dehydrogenase [Burkholderiales bacterium]